MHIILHQPEIPANTGNIGRTCVATGTDLHLIEPLGFRLNEKEIKRAGMDYWEHLNVSRYVNFGEFKAAHPGAKIWMATTKAKRSYTEVAFGPDDYIMFGKESAGIPEEILVDYEETCIRIPMLPEIRSLNLSNSVAIVLYEALRQNGFEKMEKEGHLHRLQWKENPLKPAEAVPEQQEPEPQLQEQQPEQTEYFKAPDAVIEGEVTLGKGSNVWYHAVIRGDRSPVVIGEDTNVQDNCVLHGGDACAIHVGSRVTVGHGAILHGCTIGDDTLIGMGTILLDGCRIGKGCLIGAGTLITENTEIPEHSLAVGSPGKVIRQLSREEVQAIADNARRYAKEASEIFSASQIFHKFNTNS